MSNIIRLSIDLETLDTEPTAAILSLGCVQFDVPFGQPRAEFYQKATTQYQSSYNRTTNVATLEWWNTQDANVRAEAFSGTQPLVTLLQNFEIWCEAQFGEDRMKDIELWSRGAGFDCEILKNAYYGVIGNYPFDFRNHMCQRTVEKLMPVGLKNLVPKNTAKHNALEDARYQARILDAALRNISFSWIGDMNAPGSMA